MHIARHAFSTLFVLTLAFLSGCSSGEQRTESAAPANAPATAPRIEASLDRPVSGEKVGPQMVVGGWAFSTGAPIQEISVLVDGEKVAVATHGGNRLDVVKAFPGVPGAANAGWHTVLPGSAIPAGEHQVTVRVRLTDGTERMLGPVAVLK